MLKKFLEESVLKAKVEEVKEPEKPESTREIKSWPVSYKEEIIRKREAEIA